MGIRAEFNKTRTPVLDAEGAPVEREVTSVGSLTRQCNEAANKMGARNSHRKLLLNCAFAMQQLVERLDKYERAGVIEMPKGAM